ncbi:MAG: cystathionine beta-lyase [Flavobacteriaceae bacterium]
MKRTPRPDTLITHAGRTPGDYFGFVNPPVYQGSTVLFPDVAAYKRGDQRYRYGRRGSPTLEALENAISAMEGAAGTVLEPSGLSAIAVALLSCLSSGDNVLVVDTAYKPTRHFCDTILRRMGISTTYYDPLIGADIARLIDGNTRAIFLESPGSLTFEIQDVPAITAVARERGITTIMDNTWATSLYFRPLEHGVDLSLSAATKYIGGHSDIMLGTISADAEHWRALHETHGAMGQHVGPDVAYLGQRGLRTMAVRLRQHHASGLKVAGWLETRPEVERVLHPGLESFPGHALWKRDFTGASGLFSIVMQPGPQEAVAAFIDGLDYFGIGASWGGYESLAVPFDPTSSRTATRWNAAGPAIRLHIGLEDPDDLIADLESGLERWRQAGGGG